MTEQHIVRFDLRDDDDLVLARQQTRRISELLGFERQDQTRLATAVSEIARNALRYARNGSISFSLVPGEPSALKISVDDSGPGIAAIEAVLNGSYVSRTGMGMGIVSARRLSDEFELTTGVAGTHVTLLKNLPLTNPTLEERHLDYMRKELGGERLPVMAEVAAQNIELAATMAELDVARAEVERLNGELAETNRGVLALYAEIDQKAESLRKASEEKSRFLSNMSHEFRTPLNSIISLAQILLSAADGPLTAEQHKQVTFIKSSARTLFEMVNDLLDIAKIEAGRLPVRPSQFTAQDMMNSLETLFASQVPPSVELSFKLENGGKIFSDELKVSQIVRNFISNALKYTERGTVEVTTRLDASNLYVEVSDSGIGIAPENLSRVFLEFTQIDNALQKRTKGTGLGLTLSKRLAQLLGGEIQVQSELGKGSTFSVTIPRAYSESAADDMAEVAPAQRVLIVDDDPTARYILKSLLSAEVTCFEVSDGENALELIRRDRPDAVFLDVVMPGLSGFAVLRALRSETFGAHTPVVLYTSKDLDDDERHEARELRAIIVDKRNPNRDTVSGAMEAAMRAAAR